MISPQNAYARRFFILCISMISWLALSYQYHAAAQPINATAQINKSFSPTSIIVGDPTLLTVMIYNPNPYSLSNVEWIDNLPSGMVVTTPTAVNNTCRGQVIALQGSNIISLSGGIVPAQVGTTAGQCSVTVRVTTTTSGISTNTLPRGVLQASGPNGQVVSNPDPASASISAIGVTEPISFWKSFRCIQQ